MKNIRNFVIIAHIDHGKSTLADRFLEITGAVAKENLREQYLDSMDLERERGITIKMHPCRMIWRTPNHAEIRNPKSEILNSLEFRNSNLDFAGSEFILNLIDTPGHVDFSYEISRALACVEGAVLLVDAVKGIQAQTLYNLEQAQKQNLIVIAIVNKIDLPQAKTEQTKKELSLILGVEENDILAVSGKNGTNVENLLSEIIKKIPSPKSFFNSNSDNNGFKALIFDSKYDSFSGIIAYVRVFEGEIKVNEEIYLLAGKTSSIIKEVGYFMPELIKADSLKQGEIGYIKTGIKEPLKVRVGDTIIKSKIGAGYEEVEPLAGYKEPKPVLFLSFYPQDSDDFLKMQDALNKFRLNDPALEFQVESQMALGRGFRVGFLGSLHAEITGHRLQKEYGLDLIATSPQVGFKILNKNGKELFISSSTLWPDSSQIREAQEPWVKIEIVAPNEFLSVVFKILQVFNAEIGITKPLTPFKSLLEAKVALREIISGNFYDKLKSSTKGYASFNFEMSGYRTANLVKLDILIAGKKEESFSRIVLVDDAFSEGKKIVQKLKEFLPHQQFAVALQASVNGKIIARETIKALRKDVTAPLYGGDITRRRKLLDIQKKGKKELQAKGRVNISPEVFFQVLKG